METYASIKGQPVQPDQLAITAPAAPEGDLSKEAIEHITENRAFVIEHMPELVDFIKALHSAGLISGWRSVQNCKKIQRIEGKNGEVANEFE